MLEHGKVWEVPDCPLTSLDVRFTLHPGDASCTALALLDSPQGGPRDAAIVYNWHTDCLEVAYNTYLIHHRTSWIRATEASSDEADEEESHTKPRRIGGKMGWCREHPLRVRVLFDGSCVEVFAGLSEDDVARSVLSTRIYRVESRNPGLAFLSDGGTSSVSQIDVWQMTQCWTDREEVEVEARKPCTKCSKDLRPAEKAVEMDYGEVRPGRCKKCLGLHRPGECPLGNNVTHPHGEGNA